MINRSIWKSLMALFMALGILLNGLAIAEELGFAFENEEAAGEAEMLELELLDLTSNGADFEAGAADETEFSLMELSDTAENSENLELLSNDVKVRSIELNVKRLDMSVGEQAMLVVTFNPENATNKTLRYNVSDRSILSVDDDGVITALKEGKAFIVVAANSNAKALCTVEVKEDIIGVRATAVTEDGFEVEWKSVEDACSYQVYCGTSDVFEDSEFLGEVEENRYSVSGLNPGTTYYAWVLALNKSSDVLAMDTTVVVTKSINVPVTEIKLNCTYMVLRVSQTQRLVATLLPENATDQTLKWGSTYSGYAMVDDQGFVTGVKPGTAVVYVKSANNVIAMCTVNVIPKLSPEEIPGTLTMCTGYTYDLQLPSDISGITCKTSKKAVASVANGVIHAKKAGKATITVYVDGTKITTCSVTVCTPPKSIKLDKKKLSMYTRDTVTLKATVSSGSYPVVTWNSSNDDVATVSEDGRVTATGAGSATITVQTVNKKKASCKVSVTSRPSGQPVCRALLIGEGRFPNWKDKDLPAQIDISKMEKMLKSVKGRGGAKWEITSKIDRTADQILSDIRNTFAGVQDNDISLFFIDTHGDCRSDISSGYAGCLSTYPGKSNLKLQTLAECLSEVPGKVIVLIESCGSGAAVYESNGKDYERIKKQAKAFDNAVVSAFKSVNRDIPVRNMSGALVKEDKFYVLTSSAYQEYSWVQSNGCTYFVKWVTEGVGTSGRMSADSNRDKALTLHELYKYMEKKAKVKIKGKDNKNHYQHAQVYPKNSSFVLFKR